MVNDRHSTGSAILMLLLGVLFLLVAFAVGWYLGGRAAAPAPAVPMPEPAVVAAPAPPPAPSEPQSDEGLPPYDPQLPPAREGAQLAIILDDCGQNIRHLEEMLELPYTVTYSILPRLRYSAQSAEVLRNAGLPYMLHQPMEPSGDPAPNPGPGAIMTGMDAEEVERIFSANLETVGRPHGFNNHMGSLATTDRHLMRYLMYSARSRNMFFIDSWTTASSVALEEARNAGLRASRNRFFLDNNNDYDYIRDRLTLAVRAAAEGKAVVAIGHLTKSQTRAVLWDAVDWLLDSDVALVPAGNVTE